MVLVGDAAGDRVRRKVQEVVRVQARLEVDGHAFRVRGAEPEAELGLAVRVHGLGELAVFELREVLVREHHPHPVAARLRERCRHALRHVAEAVALVHQTQERRAFGERDRSEALRGLPRAVKEYGADQVGGVLTERLRERYEQPTARGDPLGQVGRGGLAEHVA